ncbi:MAG: PQQ-binding-like beta-propeller repeat protein [Fimbriiglobus sp.]
MQWLKSLVLLAVLSGVVSAGDWPQFRGPGGRGVAEGSKPPIDISPNRHVKWKVAVPAGFSSPVVVGDRLLVTGYEKGKLLTLAYDRKTGAELWRQDAEAKEIEAFHKTEGSPAASTIVSDGEVVISYFGSVGMIAYTVEGKFLWRYDMPVATTNNDFGSGSSPVLAQGIVVLGRDLSKGSKILALNAKTGSQVWEKPRDGFATSYATPAVWETTGGTQIVFPGCKRLIAYDLKTGEQKWTVGGLSSITCTTPVVAGEELIFAAWSPGGATEMKMPSFDDLLKDGDTNKDGAIDAVECEKTFLKGFFEGNDANKDGKITRDEWDAVQKFMAGGKNCAVAIRPGGSGDISETHVRWKVTKGLPYVPSPLVYENQMYVVSMRGMLSAYDVKTGKEVFLDENVGLTGSYASPIAANGHVYLFGLDGSCVVLKAGDFADVKHRAKFGERIAATPAIVGDTIYVRSAKHLYAFEAK